jgi:hypothetical protein
MQRVRDCLVVIEELAVGRRGNSAEVGEGSEWTSDR